jgi:hypothetical protein
MTNILTTDFNPLHFKLELQTINFHHKKRAVKIEFNGSFFEEKSYLLVPALIIAQRNPMVEVAESWSIKRRVPGANQ